ncbi:MAG: type III pantothenate kinase, partial [Planctomycetales bacterium]|nr:type III pantothenate kinase [Planctomycetales bacterium]
MEAPDSILAIDIGNSSIHAGCFVDIPTMTGGRQPPLPAPVVSQAWTSEGPVPNDPMPPNAVTMNTVWVVASVNRAGLQRVRQWHDSVAPSCPFIVLARDAFSLAIDVRHPDRVGIDRLAAATAANRLRPKGRS